MTTLGSQLLDDRKHDRKYVRGRCQRTRRHSVAVSFSTRLPSKNPRRYATVPGVKLSHTQIFSSTCYMYAVDINDGVSVLLRCNDGEKKTKFYRESVAAARSSSYSSELRRKHTHAFSTRSLLSTLSYSTARNVVLRRTMFTPGKVSAADSKTRRRMIKAEPSEGRTIPPCCRASSTQCRQCQCRRLAGAAAARLATRSATK